MIRRKPPVHQNHERWLVSYADFITLLFAFFVVMFATSQKDKNSAKVVSQSIREAIQHGQLSAAMAAAFGRGPHENSKALKNAEREKLSDNLAAQMGSADLGQSLAELQKGLDAELKAGKVQLNLEPRGLVISLREAAFFASGDDTVEPASLPVLAKIAAAALLVPNSIRLEGYTDSVPIHNSRFRSNWELSSARAIAMLEVLQQKFQLPRPRLSVAGYAENAPSDSNDSDEGRAHNRRVDVVILSAEGQSAEPRGK